MKAILITQLLSVIFFGFLQGQITYKILPKDPVLDYLDIVGMDAGETGLSSSTRPATICFNMLDTKHDSAFGVLNATSEIGELKNAIRFAFRDYTSNQIVKHFWIGNNVIVVGSLLNSTNAANFILSFNWQNKLINWAKIIKPANVNAALKLIDAATSRNEIYVLSDIFVNVGPSGFNKPGVCKLDNNGNLSWSTEYDNTSLTQNEYATKIVISPNGNICFASVVYDVLSPAFGKIRLSNIKKDGELINSSFVRLFNADKSTEFRPGNIFLRTNGSNIHLVTQAVVGRSDAGPIAITMFDTSLALRTWRVYSPQLRVESFEIGRNNFILSGQRPNANGLDGFAYAIINASNAIPESLLSFEYGFHNASIATSSTADFVPQFAKHFMYAKPNAESQSQINVVLADETSISPCNEKFEFTVTKDPIEVEASSDKMTLQNYSTDNIEVKTREIEFEYFSICFPEANKDHSNKSKILWNINLDKQLIIQKLFSNKTMLQIFDLHGHRLINKFIEENAVVDLSQLTSGIYYINFSSLLGQENATFIVSN